MFQISGRPKRIMHIDCAQEPHAKQHSLTTCTRLTCSILCKIYTGFKLVSLKSLNSQQFPQQPVSSDEMPHLMQFSEAAHEPCMVHCVLLDCNGTKWKGNALSIPAGSCSQQLLKRNKLPTGCYFFACVFFSPHDLNVFVTDLIVDNVVTHVQGISSGILIIWETVWDMNKSWLMCGSRAG